LCESDLLILSVEPQHFYPSKRRGGMNTRSQIDRASIRLAPAVVMAAVAWLFCCASADAGCGSHTALPAVTLDWQSASPPAERQVPAEKPPSCSGRDCAGNPASPLVANPEPDPYRDLLDTVSNELRLVQPLKSVESRSARLSPIGRETKIERPPCCPATAAVQL
jgi:hypothetical protein